MQKSIEADQAIINEELQPSYVDNPDVIDNETVTPEEPNQIEENVAPTIDVSQFAKEPVMESLDDDPMA